MRFYEKRKTLLGMDTLLQVLLKDQSLFPGKMAKRERNLRVVALLLLGHGPEEVAAEMGMTRQRVQQVRAAFLRDWGQPMPLVHGYPSLPSPRRPSLRRHSDDVAKFFSRVAAEPSGCWRWLGAIDPAGYGRTDSRYTGIMYAHRFAYAVVAGRPLIEGMVLDHLCRNTACVNPLHLEQVTHKENSHRSPHWDHERGGWKWKTNKRKNRRAEQS